ncbi:DEAD/DEAH box helicase [Cytobacillus sp. FSL K6-0265]|uniref:DEAD/DEAH box helicase n=1 Tax=Cytobacillus sp. FSL K6-0265 TaxID=2921448 RepID=UPI0030F61119
MVSTKVYIKEWQKAIAAEISHLKQFGSKSYHLFAGRKLDAKEGYSYYFEVHFPLSIPIGSTITVLWGERKSKGRMVSVEGKNIIVTIEDYLGEDIHEAQLQHDPWELLDQLFQRLAEIKDQKKKRVRIKHLMNPSTEVKHQQDKIKSPLHELVLRSKYNPITYVWGPPGTGKTYTLARVAANKYLKNQRILVVAHSNQAVDVLMAEVYQFLLKKEKYNLGDLLRYGRQSDEFMKQFVSITATGLLNISDGDLIEEKNQLMEERAGLKLDLSSSFSQRDSRQLVEIEKKLHTLHEKLKKKENTLVKQSRIIGTTLAKMATDPLIYEDEFDYIILDEASMAYIPQIALATSLGKRTIICGDFKQLPPIASAKHPLVKKWLQEDIFHHAGVVNQENEGKLHPQLFLLNEQRRMHPDISKFTNEYIYQSLVVDHHSVYQTRENIVESQPFPMRASILLDTSSTGAYCIKEKATHSRVNLWQLLLSFQLIHEAYKAGNRSIGYVTPYRAQAILMTQFLDEIYEKEKMTAQIVSATVHRFQGSEQDMMIFDTVDGDPETRPGMLLTGQNSERLLNVALTRTKGKFIHIANGTFIRRHVSSKKIWKKLWQHQISEGHVIGPAEIGQWMNHSHPKLSWHYAKKRERLLYDLHHAKKQVIVGLPRTFSVQSPYLEVFQSLIKRGLLTICSETHLSELPSASHMKGHPSFAFIMIDDDILWVGAPFEAMTNLLPPYVNARIISNTLVNWVKSNGW